MRATPRIISVAGRANGVEGAHPRRNAGYGRLTLMTDGVIEAMTPSGELLGFDRAARLSNRPAEEIARAAQAFGQEDDITVLTLVREASTAVAA
jgi:hypothetical protein